MGLRISGKCVMQLGHCDLSGVLRRMIERKVTDSRYERNLELNETIEIKFYRRTCSFIFSEKSLLRVGENNCLFANIFINIGEIILIHLEKVRYLYVSDHCTF